MGMLEDAIRAYAAFEDRTADPATPASESALVYVKDGKLHTIDDAGTVVEYGTGGGGGGGGVTVAAVDGGGTGAITTTSTSFVDLPGMSTTIPATAGDVLDILFATYSSNSSAGEPAFFRANVGGNDVGPGTMGVHPTANYGIGAVLAVVHTVVSGDISGGNVTVKVRWRVSAGTGTIPNESTTNNRRPSLKVRNLGQ